MTTTLHLLTNDGLLPILNPLSTDTFKPASTTAINSMAFIADLCDNLFGVQGTLVWVPQTEEHTSLSLINFKSTFLTTVMTDPWLFESDCRRGDVRARRLVFHPNDDTPFLFPYYKDLLPQLVPSAIERVEFDLEASHAMFSRSANRCMFTGNEDPKNCHMVMARRGKAFDMHILQWINARLPKGSNIKLGSSENGIRLSRKLHKAVVKGEVVFFPLPSKHLDASGLPRVDGSSSSLPTDVPTTFLIVSEASPNTIQLPPLLNLLTNPPILPSHYHYSSDDPYKSYRCPPHPMWVYLSITRFFAAYGDQSFVPFVRGFQSALERFDETPEAKGSWGSAESTSEEGEEEDKGCGVEWRGGEVKEGVRGGEDQNNRRRDGTQLGETHRTQRQTRSTGKLQLPESIKSLYGVQMKSVQEWRNLTVFDQSVLSEMEGEVEEVKSREEE